MNIEKTLDKLPVWDKKIAEWMKPIEPAFNVILVLIAFLCIYAVFLMEPQYKGLLIALLVSP